LCLALLGGAAPDAQVAPPPATATPGAALRRVGDDYVQLYQKDTLAEWKALLI
jgi:hypothetical protein